MADTVLGAHVFAPKSSFGRLTFKTVFHDNGETPRGIWETQSISLNGDSGHAEITLVDPITPDELREFANQLEKYRIRLECQPSKS